MPVSDATAHILTLRKRTLDLRGSCRIMGILNVTPDSFSDGGLYIDTDAAVRHALRMEAEGADIIDIGGESTRPGAAAVSADEERSRVLPVIEALRRTSDIPVSIDTRKAAVARDALDAGADIINDVSALRDDADMPALAAASGAPVVLMHMQGQPDSMQRDPRYADVVDEVLVFFRERIAACEAAGIRQIVIDPGIGFGKTVEHNLTLLRELSRFHELGRPLLVGTSRKSFIGTLTGLAAAERLPGSLASSLLACQKGARLLRVHDVRETRAALAVFTAIEQGEEVIHAV